MKAAGLFQRLVAPGLALWLSAFLLAPATAADWPQYRGANHDGISTDRLNKQWTGSVTNPVWRVLLTNGLSSLAVSGGRVFTQARRLTNGQDKELCVALNAATGVELWATAVDINSHPSGGVGFDDGPRTTPAVDGDSVFVWTSYLRLLRLNVTNGTILWEKNLASLYGGAVIGYENSASPIIENGRIFLNANCGTSTLMTLRTSDGEPAWRSQNDAMTHSTPVLATIHGVRQVIFATQSGLVSLDPATGYPLWRAGYSFSYGTSLGASPVVDNDLVFVGGAHAYGMGSMVVRVDLAGDTWSASRLWATNNPASHWMTPVARQGFLYGHFGIQSFDSVNAQFKCVDMRTGAVKWSVNGFGRGATILVDDLLVSITERGQAVLIRPDTNAYIELARFTAIPNYADFTNKCWNGPAICDGRLFVRSTSYVAAFDLSLPRLVMDPPQFIAPGGLALSIRTANGAPLDSNRLAGFAVRASSDPALALPSWTLLTNRPVLTGGVVRVGPVTESNQPQRFFIVSEPQ